MITTKDQNSEQSIHQKRNYIRFALWAIVIIAIVGAAFFASTKKELFKAELTQTGSLSNDNFALYIPNDYEAQAGDTVLLEVKVGTGDWGTNEKIFGFSTAKFSFNPNQISFASGNIFEFDGTRFAGLASIISELVYENELRLAFGDLTPGGGVTLSENDIIFKMRGVLDANLNPGVDIVTISNTDLVIEGEVTTLSLDTNNFGDGVITIAVAPCTSVDWQCPDFTEGVCNAANQETRGCTLISNDCNDGPDGIYGKPDVARLCTCDADDWQTSCTNWGACEQDSKQYRTCTLPDTCVARSSTPLSPPVSQDCGLNVDGLILSLAQDELNRLDQLPENANQEKRDAFSAAYLMVNSSNALGHTITFHGLVGVSDVEIIGDDCGIELDCINDIVRDASDGLLNTLEVEDDGGNPLIMASEVPNMAGVIKLEPTVHNLLGWIDMSTTAGDVRILPALENVMTISPTASISLQVVGKFIDGSAQNLSFNQVTWSPQPINQLDNAQLIGGILERGDVAGETSLEAVVQKDEGSVHSNQIRVNVPRGPIIEPVFIEGAGSIEPDDQFYLNARVSDVDQISDIANIQTLLIDSDYNTYDEIMANAGQGDFITINPYIDDVEVSEEGDDGEGEAGGGDEVGENYRIYRIPVYVPANVFEGSYKLVLEIIDTAGFTAHAVIPIYIGAAVWGDVDSDGFFNMADVIRAFEISVDPFTATAREKAAADVVSPLGSVNLADVKTLFDALQ